MALAVLGSRALVVDLLLAEMLLEMLTEGPPAPEVTESVNTVYAGEDGGNGVVTVDNVLAPELAVFAPVPGTMLSVTCGPIPCPHCPKIRVIETEPAGAAVTVVVGTHVVVITPRFD